LCLYEKGKKVVRTEEEGEERGPGEKVDLLLYALSWPPRIVRFILVSSKLWAL